MIIATNTPLSFPASAYKFVQLDESTDASNVDVIVLMLEKNWGAKSVTTIEKLFLLISRLPDNVPCFMLGCETTIPDLFIEKYRHRARDEAVLQLCLEVLKRSKSILCRGEITRNYLVNFLGLDSSKVLNFNLKNSREYNLGLLRDFTFNNNCDFLLNAEDAICDFQFNPFEMRADYSCNIFISLPRIKELSGGKSRVIADITIDSKTSELWCEVDDCYSQYLLVEHADAFVCALLPLAIRTGRDIVCASPVSVGFYHNLVEILLPHLCKYDSRLYESKIVAETSELPTTGSAVTTAMSCGVDSFYTYNEYFNSKYPSMSLSHLYVGNYLYGNEGAIYERASKVAQFTGLPIIKTATNLNEFFDLPHLHVHFYKTMFGVLSLRKLFKIYYYSSGEDFSSFKLRDNSIDSTLRTELLLLYTFSSDGLTLITGGGKASRLYKTKSIVDQEVVQQYLNVCLNPHLKVNCGTCGKCYRTLLMIDMLGCLDKFTLVFDIDKYKNNRKEAFKYLIKNSRDPVFHDVYSYFLSNESLLINAVIDELKLQP